jgi:hypothetical protein
MGYFRETRDCELSVIYYLETQITNDWSGVTVIKSFTDAYKGTLPIVCIRLTDTTNNRREVGSVTLLNDYTITVDIFATSDGQRLDLADYIMSKLNDGCVFYNHSQTSGTPTSLTRVADGRLYVHRFILNQALDFGEDADKYDRHRHLIQITFRKSE